MIIKIKINLILTINSNILIELQKLMYLKNLRIKGIYDGN